MKNVYENRRTLTISMEEENLTKLRARAGNGGLSRYIAWMIEVTDPEAVESLEAAKIEILALKEEVVSLRTEIVNLQPQSENGADIPAETLEETIAMYKMWRAELGGRRVEITNIKETNWIKPRAQALSMQPKALLAMVHARVNE